MEPDRQLPPPNGKDGSQKAKASRRKGGTEKLGSEKVKGR